MITPLLLALSAQHPGGDWEVFITFNGLAGDNLGHATAAAGDIDQDGFPDFIVGAWNDTVSGMNSAGSASIVSGRTGTRIRELFGARAGDFFGWSVAGGGDANGDGTPDVIIGAWGEGQSMQNRGSAYVYSGINGALLYQFRGENEQDLCGYSVADAGDVNLDGFDDVLVGAPRVDVGLIVDAGAAYLYSGFDGSLIRRLDGAEKQDNHGTSVASVGDVDGDGIPDQVVGAPFADRAGLNASGAVYVYSGASGAVIDEFIGLGDTDFLGFAVAQAGDLDGDGAAELIAGAFGADPGGRNNAGSAYVISAVTGLTLHQADGDAPGDNLGVSVTGGGDVDGDGWNDVVVGARYADPEGLINAGSAYVVSGRDGAFLHRVDGRFRDDNLGRAVAIIGDVKNPDGRDDVLIGADKADPQGRPEAGQAIVVGLAEPYLDLSSYELSAASGADVQATLDFPRTEIGYSYVLLAAGSTGVTELAGLSIPLARDALFDQILAGQAPQPMAGAYGVLDNDGDGAAVLRSHPALAGSVGQTYYLAAVSYDPLAVAGRLSSVPRPLLIIP